MNYESVERVFRAMSDPHRRAILEQLSKKESAVKDLTAHFKISQPAISQHLATLKNAGLVRERHEGRRVIYRVQAEGFRPLIDWLSHYKAFWPERVDKLKKLLTEMEE